MSNVAERPHTLEGGLVAIPRRGEQLSVPSGQQIADPRYTVLKLAERRHRPDQTPDDRVRTVETQLQGFG